VFFAVSHKPIYLGNTLLLLGLAIVMPAYWLLPMLVVAFVMINKFLCNAKKFIWRKISSSL
jgi:protein-S-isoprenylcysteine O-methyltransferase Ste14